MVTATAHNIRTVLHGYEPSEKATWNAICLADFGIPARPSWHCRRSRPQRQLVQGRQVGASDQVAFEKYFMRKMKKGSTEALYEKYVLGLMGIKKLR